MVKDSFALEPGVNEKLYEIDPLRAPPLCQRLLTSRTGARLILVDQASIFAYSTECMCV